MALDKIPNLLLLYTIPKILDSDSASENCFLGTKTRVTKRYFRPW